MTTGFLIHPKSSPFFFIPAGNWPFTDGKALYESCGAGEKRMVMIPDADHNTIFVRGFRLYLSAVTDFFPCSQIDRENRLSHRKGRQDALDSFLDSNVNRHIFNFMLSVEVWS